MKHHRRHVIIWNLLSAPLWLITRLRFHFHAHSQKLPEPFLVVSNHVTDWDPVMLPLSIRKQAYFVASEHAVAGRVGALISWLQAPITRRKGTVAAGTALKILRTLKAGYNVALFPEGNRTYNGRTCAIVPSTARLARRSGAYLVTHRFTGGYFASPRWSGNSARRGYMSGDIIGIYSPEDLKAMTDDQVLAIMRRDLAEDAYDTQEQQQQPFYGRRPAEHLECALYLCPRCKNIGTLHSRGNTLSCTCGMSAKYTPLGYLQGENLPWHTVTVWDLWQAKELTCLVTDAAPDTVITRDPGLAVTEISDDGTRVTLGTAELSVTPTELRVGDILTAPLNQIAGLALIGAHRLVLQYDNRHFYIDTPDKHTPWCARKYVAARWAALDPSKILDV